MKTAAQGWNLNTETAESEQVFDAPCGLDAQEFRALAESVAIVLPHLSSEGLQGGLFDVASQWGLAGSTVLRMEVPHAGFVDLARGMMVERFREVRHSNPKLKFMVMIDTDQAVEFDAPYRLAFWNREVVSGIVCSVAGRGTFACVMPLDAFGKGRFPSVSKTKTMPARGIVKVVRSGTGLLCIRNDVFDKFDAAGEIPFLISHEVRVASVKEMKIKMGEDMWFCKQALALGIELWADLSVHAKHYKKVAISWPASAIDSRLDVENWEISQQDWTDLV